MAKRLVALFIMIIMVVAPVAVVSAAHSNVTDLGAKTSFVPRLKAPSKSNKYYYSDLNKFEKFGYGMPNCTAYAWGRAYEIMGYEPTLSLNDADTWWDYNKENKYYPCGSKPKLGAVACWDYTDGGGHVAVVEEIKDGKITYSNSAYGGTNFYLTYVDEDASNGGIYNSTWIFRGYIYITEGQTREEYYQSLGADVYKVDSYDGINLRKGPGTSYSTLTAIPDGTEIVVKATKNAEGYTWGKTTFDGYTGWCVLDFTELVHKYVKPVPTPPPVPEEPKEPEPTLPETTVPEETLPATYDEATFDEATFDEATSDEATSDEAGNVILGGSLLVGDANGDGKITIKDATVIQKHLAKISKISDQKINLADMNRDGKITVADATAIQKKIAGIMKSYI